MDTCADRGFLIDSATNPFSLTGDNTGANVVLGFTRTLALLPVPHIRSVAAISAIWTPGGGRGRDTEAVCWCWC